MDAKAHWNKIYHDKTAVQLSWTEAVPATSLAFIESFALGPDARILDVGGGESRLADCLLDRGFRNITVLDISAEALRHAQERLGDRAALVQWVVADIADYTPEHPFDVWHDRATFHFLTTQLEVRRYLSGARAAVRAGGYVVIGSFSHSGPEKCSGLPVRQYNEPELTLELKNGFNKIRCITEDHRTPWDAVQEFLFCSFRRA